MYRGSGQGGGGAVDSVNGKTGVVIINAEDVGALADTTKYVANATWTIDSSTYVMTLQLKDQDGANIGTAQTIDLPLESVVVGGSYDSTNKKIVLTLNNGTTIDVPVADLVSGLQSEITAQSPLSADLVDDNNTTHKFVSAAEKSTWNGKQDAINDLATIRSGAAAGATSVQPTAIADMETQTHASATYATKAELADKQDIIQYSTMPTASVDNVGDIVQFVGVTDSTYTNGHFYKCVSDGQDPATYSWEEVSFGGGQTIQVDTMPVAGADNLNKVVQYVGETDSTYMNGCFYRCQRTVAPVETFYGTPRIYNAIKVFNREVFAEKILEIFPNWSSTSQFDVSYRSGQGWRIAGTDPLIYVADLSEFGIEISVTPGDYEYMYFSPGAVIYAWISAPKNLVGVYTMPDTATANIGAVVQYLGESGVKSGAYVRTGGCYKNTKQTQSAVITSSLYITSPAINASDFIAQVKNLTSTQNIAYIGSAEFRYTPSTNRWDITFLENNVRISNISSSLWGLTYSGTTSTGATVKISYNLGINAWVEDSEIPTTTGVDWGRILMVNTSGKPVWGYTKTINGQRLVNLYSSSDIEITGLPSTTSATQGQVLTLDANLNAVWQAGGSGGGSVPTLTWYTVSTAGNTLTIADTSSAQLVKVYKNGLLLEPTADYSISGTTLTTVTAMVVGDKITMEVF